MEAENQKGLEKFVGESSPTVIHNNGLGSSSNPWNSYTISCWRLGRTIMPRVLLDWSCSFNFYPNMLHHSFFFFFNIKFATDVILKSLYIWRKKSTLHFIWFLLFLLLDLEMRYASKLYQNLVKCSGLPKMFSWPSLKTAFQSEVNL